MYHEDPRAFVVGSADYGAISRTLVTLSNLEFAHDTLMLSVSKNRPSVATRLSSKFPRQFRDKVDFLIQLIASSPELRRVPIFGISLNLQWLQYQLDELCEARNVIAHGSIFYTEKADGGYVWRFDRVAKKPNSQLLTTVSVELGSAFLADVARTAFHLKHYLHDLTEAVEGRFDWEMEYKSDCENRRNARALKQDIESGLYEADEWIVNLMSLYDEQ